MNVSSVSRFFMPFWLPLYAGMVLLLSLLPVAASGQTTLRGTVSGRQTGRPLPYVTVRIAGHDEGTTTDLNGKFELSTGAPVGKIIFSALGYETITFSYQGSQVFKVTLAEDHTALDEVVVRSKKERYRNKDNPAVALIQQVIAHKEENQLGVYDYVQYEEYEKMQFGYLTDRDATLELNSPLIKPYRFVFENIDTTRFEHKALLPLYLEENIKHQYRRRDPPAKQTIWEANKKVHFDDRFVNNNGATTAMRFLYQDVDVYQNNIYILANSFLSPINSLAPTFYKFYIADTVSTPQGQKAIQLVFVPRNKNDLLFNGQLYISMDGHYSVISAQLGISNTANLNWVTGLKILLSYEAGSDKRYHLSRSVLRVTFGSDPHAKRALFGERMRIFSHYNTQSVIPDSIFALPQAPKAPDTSQRKSLSYWERERPEPLTRAEAATYHNNDSLIRMRSFEKILDWGSLLFSGYKHWGPLEIGPTGTFFSFNPVEGYKQRIGARTTQEFSPRFYGAGYLGYGFKDHRLKYYLSWAYSFNKKSIYDYPVHYLRASVQRDIGIPGRGFQFEEEANILLSFKRGDNYRYLYNDIYQLEYVYEFGSHIRIEGRYKRWTQAPAGDYQFTSAADNRIDTISSLTTSDLGVTLRWAPHEQFFDQKEGRARIPNRYPVITGGVTFGISDLAGGEYDYQKVDLNIKKRFYLSQLGFADATLEGGYLWGSVPYPLLFIPHANETYNFQYRSFNLMNFMEFVSDQYFAVYLDYHMQGFIFNKIPLLKWLRFREVAGFSILYGSLRAESIPTTGSGLFRFPVNAEGIPTTYALGPKPYIEFNVGIENIFRVIRVDYVRRLSYLNHPDIDPSGIRLSVNISF